MTDDTRRQAARDTFHGRGLTEGQLDDQKREMIEALWSIVIAFVDLQWEITDASKETCGQTLDLRAALEAAVLNSETSSKPDDLGTAPTLGTNDAAQPPITKEPV